MTLRNIGVIRERLLRFCAGGGGAQTAQTAHVQRRQAAGLLPKSFPSKPPPPDCTLLTLVTVKILTKDQLFDIVPTCKGTFGELGGPGTWRLSPALKPCTLQRCIEHIRWPLLEDEKPTKVAQRDRDRLKFFLWCNFRLFERASVA